MTLSVLFFYILCALKMYFVNFIVIVNFHCENKDVCIYEQN